MLRAKRELLLLDFECDLMRFAGKFNASVMDYLRPYVKAGITTGELDELAHDFIVRHKHRPACLGYQGFPKSICTSVNDVVCHGIPGDYVLQDGDIVNIDVTTIVNGWLGDQSETFMIGEVSDEVRSVVQCAHDCLYLAIRAITPNCRVADVGRAICTQANQHNFGVVREYVGHGIGRRFHQEPSIPHYPNRQAHIDRLHPGMCFTIEPMINAGTRETVLDRADGWTVRTKDGQVSAQFEHTILMTEDGPEILTLTEQGPQEGHSF